MLLLNKRHHLHFWLGQRSTGAFNHKLRNFTSVFFILPCWRVNGVIHLTICNSDCVLHSYFAARNNWYVHYLHLSDVFEYQPNTLSKRMCMAQRILASK